jgi:hypothetical protein
MRQQIIRYQVRPDQAARNEELIRAVYAELRATAPPGLSYAAFRHRDSPAFVHLVQLDGPDGPSPLLEVAAFQEFQAGIGERCEVAPVRAQLRQIGSYGMFGGPPP